MSGRISRRRFLGATVALGGGALLTGCGGGSSGSGSGGGGASGEVVYNTFLDPANTKDPRAVAQTAAIRAFEAANPKVKVRSVSTRPARTSRRPSLHGLTRQTYGGW